MLNIISMTSIQSKKDYKLSFLLKGVPRTFDTFDPLVC